MLTIPNLITLVRLVLVPVVGYFLLGGEYGLGLIVFLAAAVTDLIDGFIEFAALLAVMASAARWIETDRWLPAAFVSVFATVIASGVQYIWVWGWKAFRDSRRARYSE